MTTAGKGLNSHRVEKFVIFDFFAIDQEMIVLIRTLSCSKYEHFKKIYRNNENKYFITNVSLLNFDVFHSLKKKYPESILINNLTCFKCFSKIDKQVKLRR